MAEIQSVEGRWREITLGKLAEARLCRKKSRKVLLSQNFLKRKKKDRQSNRHEGKYQTSLLGNTALLPTNFIFLTNEAYVSTLFLS